MSMVISEIDLGDGNVADASTQLGSTAMPESVSALQPQGDRQVGAQPPPAEAVATMSTETPEETTPVGDEGVKWETAPEHFRNSYQKLKAEREQERLEKETYKTDLESMRAKQGQGVYLTTDVPIEDFNPYEGLQRMATEEPEYHDVVVDAILEAHMWPNMAEKIAALKGKVLGRFENGAHVFDNETEQLQYQQLSQIWDFMADRTAGISGTTLSRIIAIVGSNPEILASIEAKMNGDAAFTPPRQSSGYQQSPQGSAGASAAMGVQSLQEIARQESLDLSEPEHLAQAQRLQNAQRQAVAVQTQLRSELSTQNSQIAQLKAQLDKVQGGQQQAQNVSAQDAERQAESRVAEHLKTAIDTEFTEKYAGAIPKDRPGLSERLKMLTRERLNENPNFKEAKANAMKWFKQASTRSGEQKERDEQRGLDALAVIATLRSNTMADEYRELLGKLPAQTREARQKSDTTRNKRELPGGTVATTVPSSVPAAAVGDIDATRLAVRERMRKAGIRL